MSVAPLAAPSGAPAAAPLAAPCGDQQALEVLARRKVPVDHREGSAVVVAVHRDGRHRFSKAPVDAITLRAGLGVEGDAHFGATVQHLSRVRRDPTAPNLRQVHLIHAEVIEALTGAGYRVAPGRMGENVTTKGLDMLGLPTGATLRLGGDAVVEVTGLRNPCRQLDRYQDGLMDAVLERAGDGTIVRLAGVMGVVTRDGTVRAGDVIDVTLPEGEWRPLEPV